MPERTTSPTLVTGMATLPTRILVSGEGGRTELLWEDESLSLMQVLKGADVEGIAAVCGGNCSCATCHVYIDPGYVSLLPEMAGDEDALLDGSFHRRENSRLSCQVRFKNEFDGMAVEVAPLD